MKVIGHRSKWILVSLFVLVCTTGWIKYQSLKDSVGTASTSKLIPSFFATEVRLDRFNPQGVLRSHLNADSLTNYGSYTVLVRPDLSLTNQSSTSTTISADEATFLTKDLIELRGNVSFRKNDLGGKSKIAFSSPSASVDLKLDTVTTEELTTTSFGKGNGKSVGAKFYNSTGILKLTSKTSMYYANQTRQ
jgi:LPS export ABC transporter protein LptC